MDRASRSNRCSIGQRGLCRGSLELIFTAAAVTFPVLPKDSRKHVG